MHKSIGFLSFGYWHDGPGSGTSSAAQALSQSVDLAVAAEEIGVDGAYFRVHHFAQQLTAPFPLLAAAAARTSRIQLGTGVIDMRYENPLYMAENAATTDLIAAGRLQLGLSRGAPGQAKDGPGLFGYASADGIHDVAEAREKTTRFLYAIEGTPLADADHQWAHRPGRRIAIEPQSPGLRDRIWWERRHPADRPLGGYAGSKPPKFDCSTRRHRCAPRRGSGRADPPLPGDVA